MGGYVRGAGVVHGASVGAERVRRVDAIGAPRGGIMANDDNGTDVRARLLDLLIEKIVADTYPSETMLDMIEQILTPDDVAAYAGVLMQKIEEDSYPSVSMLRRVLELA
jgi:hypothetical protein